MDQFSRSNVAESTLEVSRPDRSSFDFYHRSHVSLPIGKFVPVMVQSMMPNSIISGVVTPELTLEPVGTPQIGPLRQDIHTFAVKASRINRDWVRFINKESGFDRIPSFNISELFGKVFSELLGGRDASFLDSLHVGDNSWNVRVLYDTVSLTLFEHSQNTSDGGEFGYMRDWFLIESMRLSNLGQQYSRTDTWDNFVNAIYEIMKPYFGEGSILDNLRYPIFNYFGSAMSCIRRSQDLEPYSFADFGLGGLFRIAPMGMSFEMADISLYECNEMMLRAAYCAWFDGLRNWHVEEKENLPNPNNWDTTSMFIVFQSSHGTQWLSFQGLASLLIPRYRTFGADALTSIQTDDIFRHVFNPIFSFTDSSASVRVSSPDEDLNSLNTIYQVLFNGVGKVFPQGLFRRQVGISFETDIYLNDLQTLRRSGWLEDYLARDYFFPDTFVGQMAAHWNAQPKDILMYSANYIGGSESFVSGDQLIASTNGTDGVTGTPAGTRTFAGGATSSDSILFGSDADFCYLVTFASLQPIPTYDSKDMHLCELTYADLPFPEFAADTRVEIAARDMIRGIENVGSLIGYVPRNYAWRTSLDSVHGQFLREKRSLIWLRDWWSTSGGDMLSLRPDEKIAGSPFTITAYGLHVHVSQDAFNTAFQPEDHVMYGSVTFNYSCQCPLPAAVQKI